MLKYLHYFNEITHLEYDRLAALRISGQITTSEVKKEAQRLGAIQGGLISGPKKKIISDEGRKNMSAGQQGKRITKEHVSKVVAKVSRYWIITDPQGKTVTIHNKAKFCRENNLTPNTMSLVAQGKQTHHKGWKIKKVSYTPIEVRILTI